MTGVIGDASYMAIQNGLLINTKKASDLLQISERTLWSLMKSGEIPHISIGRSIRYDPRALSRWVESKKAKSSKTEREGEMNENGNAVVVNEEEVVKGLHLFQDFQWTKRARSAFHQCNIHTLEQLLSMNPRRITRVENVGKVTLREIQKKLNVRGLSLKLTKNMIAGIDGDRCSPENPGRLAGLEKARQVLAVRKYEDDKQKEADLFAEVMDKAIASGAIAAAQLLLECCSQEMAKRMIDLVTAIGRETK